MLKTSDMYRVTHLHYDTTISDVTLSTINRRPHPQYMVNNNRFLKLIPCFSKAGFLEPLSPSAQKHI